MRIPHFTLATKFKALGIYICIYGVLTCQFQVCQFRQSLHQVNPHPRSCKHLFQVMVSYCISFLLLV